MSLSLLVKPILSEHTLRPSSFHVSHILHFSWSQNRLVKLRETVLVQQLNGTIVSNSAHASFCSLRVKQLSAETLSKNTFLSGAGLEHFKITQSL